MRARMLHWALLGLVLGAAPVAAAARLEANGVVLSRRHVEAVLAPALRVPRDSTQLSDALARVVAELQNLGYARARASAAWDSGTTAVLRLDIREGARTPLASVTIDTPTPRDSATIAEALGAPPSRWFSPGTLGSSVEHALAAVVDQGYPYAQLGVSAVEWDSLGARVHVSGALGPAVTIARVRIDGLAVTRPAVAQRAVGRLVGTSFNQSAAVSARDRLAQLGLFKVVRYDGLEGQGDWSRGELVYTVAERPYNSFEGAIGVQSEGRPVGLARLGLDNLAGTARALGLHWESPGRGLSTLGARYVEPLVFGAPVRAEVALEQQNQDTLYTRTQWGGSLEFALSDRERVSAGYRQERVIQPAGVVEEAQSQITEFGLEHDGRDVPVSPRRGVRARLEASQTFKGEDVRPIGHRSARSSAVAGEMEWHHPLRARSGVTLELSGAGRFSSERVLPIFERYPVGGAASLRGFDEEAFRVDKFALSRLEWRWFLGPGPERVFVFWDHALMATRQPTVDGGDTVETLNRDGFGFGLRIAAAGGTVGVDYGLEPGRAPLEGKIHLRLVTQF